MNLAYNLRPKLLSEFVGQNHIIGKNKIINKMIENKFLSSIIFHGNPGSGKTTLANIIANELTLPYFEFNASNQSKKDLENLISKQDIKNPPIIFIDEIHRMDKAKQDYLLKPMEQRSIIIIGATTENPYISINPAIRSRAHILELKTLSKDDMKKIIDNALSYIKNTNPNIRMDNEAKNFLLQYQSDDIRNLIKTIELASIMSNFNEITISIIKQITGKNHIKGDKDGSEHYNLLSAFQKSIRGSDVDASLHYLTRLIQIGDLQSITRRLSIIAFEDIGLADLTIVNTTINAINVAKSVGFPEAKIPLSVAVCSLALAPKSNIAYNAVNLASNAIKTINPSIPMHLRDNHFKNADKLGHKGYVYPHDYPHHYTRQQYLPDEIKNDSYFKTNTKESTNIEKYLKIYEKLKGV